MVSIKKFINILIILIFLILYIIIITINNAILFDSIEYNKINPVHSNLKNLITVKTEDVELNYYPYNQNITKHERYHTYFFILKNYYYTGYPLHLNQIFHCKDDEGQEGLITFTELYATHIPNLEIYFDQFYDFFENHIPKDIYNQYNSSSIQIPRVIHALEPPNIRYCSLLENCMNKFNWSIGYESWSDVMLNHGNSDLYELGPLTIDKEFLLKKKRFINERNQNILDNKFNDSLIYSYFDFLGSDQQNQQRIIEIEKSSDYNPGLPLASWFCSKCFTNETQSNRYEYVKELMKYIRIDSYGGCLKNMPKDEKAKRFSDIAMEVKQEIISNYKFYLSFENSNCIDYITEKSLHAINVGSVPVIMGHPQILKYLPKGSFIYAGDFNNAQQLSNYLKMLDQNDEEYLKYFDWRKNKTIIKQYRDINGYPSRPNGRNWICPLFKYYKKWEKGEIKNKNLNKLNLNDICLIGDFIKYK